MDNNQTLIDLIERVSASAQPVSLGWDEARQWRDGVIEGFIAAGLLTKDVNSRSLVCAGCEQRCFMPVYLTDDAQRAFIVCEEPDRQSQMGRVKVPLERLQQWEASARGFAVVVADLLGLESKPVYQKSSTSYALGMLKSESGRRWVSLLVQPLALEINRRAVPLSDLIYFDDDMFTIDKPRIKELLDTAPSDTGKVYTPDVSKREKRKLATQEMYENWRDEYLALKKNYPNKPDTWYSMKISRLPIALGRDSETIRKNMKKN